MIIKKKRMRYFVTSTKSKIKKNLRGGDEKTL
jgi:hypothetical protein